MLARIDHIGQRPFGNPPCRIGRYHLLRPVLVDDMQLAEKPGRTVRPHPVNLRIVKAVAQHRADRVLATAYPIGHVVAEVHDPIFPEIVLQRNRSPVQVRPLAVIRLIGDEHVVADFLPVHVQFEITESRPVKTGRSHRLIRTECLAQQRGARRNLPADIRQRLVALPRSSDPLTLPVGLVEQSHMPYGRLAPFGNAAAIVPDADLPPAALARAQGTAAVGNQDRTVVLHLTAIPQIGLAGQQSLLGRRHRICQAFWLAPRRPDTASLIHDSRGCSASTTDGSVLYSHVSLRGTISAPVATAVAGIAHSRQAAPANSRKIIFRSFIRSSRIISETCRDSSHPSPGSQI